MQTEAQRQAPDNNPAPFAPAREAFAGLESTLCGATSMGMAHHELEMLIDREGKEVMRRLFQGHLMLRHLREHRLESVVGSDGVERTHRRERSRSLMTVFGPVTVERYSYGQRGRVSLSPLDSELNLPEEKQSHGVRRRSAIESSKNSFDEAVQHMNDTTGASVAKRQVEELAQRAASDFDRFYSERSALNPEDRESTGSINVLTTDGKGVRLHLADLRTVTREAAKRKREAAALGGFRLGLPKSREAVDRDRKRMATVASVYTIQPFVRRPEDVVGELRRLQPEKRNQDKPKAEQKRVWASLKHEPEEVVHQMYEEALRRDPDVQKSWIALVDGNENQIALLEQLKVNTGIDISIILDFIHVAGYVWKAGHVFHERGSKAAAEWVQERLLDILRGNASTVAAAMRRSATMKGLSKKARKPVDTCANYLLKYRDYLRYDRYLASGYPIATGVIEGACRYLVKDRMELTGAVWGIDSAEAVLKLRALRASGDFDEYWEYHVTRENDRNHQIHYEGQAPKVTELADRPLLRLVK